MSRLSQVGFSEIASSSEFCMKDYLHMMERIVFDEMIEEKEGTVLGFGLTLSSVLLYGDFHEFGVNCFQKLKNLAEDLTTETLTTIYGQTVCFSLVCVTNALFFNEEIDGELFTEICGMVQRFVEESPKVSCVEECGTIWICFLTEDHIIVTKTGLKDHHISMI